MSRHSYRGKDGRFERCTVQNLFGIQVNKKGTKYHCLRCGYVFVPIIESGKCVKCQSIDVIQVKDVQEMVGDGNE